MAAQPSLRIGDREREAVAAELREHYAHGRLTLDEFNQRIEAVFAAKTQADLTPITRDLPHVRPGGSPLPSSRAGRYFAQPSSDGSLAGKAGAGWQNGGRQHAHQHHHFGVLATLLAALASFAIVYDVILATVQVPLAGRVALLAVIFAFVRGLLRRVFRGGRSGRGPRGRRGGRSW